MTVREKETHGFNRKAKMGGDAYACKLYKKKHFISCWRNI